VAGPAEPVEPAVGLTSSLMAEILPPDSGIAARRDGRQLRAWPAGRAGRSGRQIRPAGRSGPASVSGRRPG
jgi:hypothetical protein